MAWALNPISCQAFGVLHSVTVAPDQRGYFVVPDRLRKEVPLGEFAVQFLQKLQLIGGLDAFGDDAHADVLGQSHDCTHDFLGFAARVEIRYERPVDLEGIDRELMKVA